MSLDKEDIITVIKYSLMISIISGVGYCLMYSISLGFQNIFIESLINIGITFIIITVMFLFIIATD